MPKTRDDQSMPTGFSKYNPFVARHHEQGDTNAIPTSGFGYPSRFETVDPQTATPGRKILRSDGEKWWRRGTAQSEQQTKQVETPAKSPMLLDDPNGAPVEMIQKKFKFKLKPKKSIKNLNKMFPTRSRSRYGRTRGKPLTKVYTKQDLYKNVIRIPFPETRKIEVKPPTEADKARALLRSLKSGNLRQRKVDLPTPSPKKKERTEAEIKELEYENYIRTKLRRRSPDPEVLAKKIQEERILVDRLREMEEAEIMRRYEEEVLMARMEEEEYYREMYEREMLHRAYYEDPRALERERDARQIDHRPLSGYHESSQHRELERELYEQEMLERALWEQRVYEEMGYY